MKRHSNGKQSKINYKLSSVPLFGLQGAIMTLTEGSEKYGPENHKFISSGDNIDHMFCHTLNYLVSREIEELSHVAARAIMALDAAIREVNCDDDPGDNTTNLVMDIISNLTNPKHKPEFKDSTNKSGTGTVQ